MEAQLPTTYLTKQDVARLLQVSVRTVENFMSRGLLPFFRIGRTVRFRLKDIEAHLIRFPELYTTARGEPVLARSARL